MCGRYTLATPDPSQLRARFPIGESLELRRRFNIAPGDDVLAVIGPRPGEASPASSASSASWASSGSLAAAEGGSPPVAAPTAALLRWGLVPFWASDPREIGVKTINARAETIAERPAYRDAFARRRCLILADGFYEWSGGVPHWITRADGEPFAFAGLWASWRPRDGAHAHAHAEPLRSCAIVTTAAAGPVRELHDRMPVILGRHDEALWIAPDADVDDLHALLDPAAAPALEHRPVSRAVNDARHDEADCLDPPEQASLF